MSLIHFHKQNDLLKVEISEHLSNIIDKKDLPLYFVVTHWISSEIIWQTELTPDMWATYDNTSFKNFFVYTKNGKLLKSRTYDPVNDGGDIEDFFNIWTKLNEGTRGLVLGAGTGQWGEWVYPVVDNRCFVVLVEGDPENHNFLEFAYKNKKNVQIVKKVVTSDGRDVVFWKAPQGMVSSIDREITEKFWPSDTLTSVNLDSVSINSLIDTHFPDGLDWIRVDVEGKDHEILMSINTSVIKNLKMIVYENMNISLDQKTELNNHLSNFGFNTFLDFGIDTVCLKK